MGHVETRLDPHRARRRLGSVFAQSDNRIDLQRPDAPELAAFGGHAVGVRTLDVVDPGRIDILNTTSGAEAPRYDRPLTLEVWYPAALPEGAWPRAAPTRSSPATARPPC
jgi:hypothetical protein